MPLDAILLGFLCFFVIAALYSTVGHAGASGYLAVMALLSFPSHEIKPVSLILNIIVASIASYRFLKEGYFDKKVFLLFAGFSIPMAFVGGYFKADDHVFKLLAGIFLLLSALMVVYRITQSKAQTYAVKPVKAWKAGLLGSAIGYTSGLIGVGGGIFLSPILLLSQWALPKNISGTSALFILVNSVLGLAGHVSAINSIPKNTFYWMGAVVLGGLLGSHLGTQKIKTNGIYIVLSVVLFSAGIKMLFF